MIYRSAHAVRSLALLVALATATVLWTAPLAEACPNCKQTLAEEVAPDRSASQGQTAAAGYNYSIFIMLGSLYLMVGGFVGAGVYYIRKNSPNINKT